MNPDCAFKQKRKVSACVCVYTHLCFCTGQAGRNTASSHFHSACLHHKTLLHSQGLHIHHFWLEVQGSKSKYQINPPVSHKFTGTTDQTTHFIALLLVPEATFCNASVSSHTSTHRSPSWLCATSPKASNSSCKPQTRLDLLQEQYMDGWPSCFQSNGQSCTADVSEATD